MNAYNYMKKLFSKPKSTKDYGKTLIGLRSEASIERVNKPLKPGRARTLGYKAKTGYSIIRVKIKKGGRKRRPFHGASRKPSKSGLTGFVTTKSLQLIAEERAYRKYPNLEVINSYWVGEDGVSKWFEVIMVDPKLPEISGDNKLIGLISHKKRVLRGLTSRGRKMRGLIK